MEREREWGRREVRGEKMGERERCAVTWRHSNSKETLRGQARQRERDRD